MTTKGEPDPLLFAFFNEVGIISQLAQARLQSRLPEGMLVPHFIVLNHLVRVGEGRSPVEIARAFQLTKGAVTNTLQRLEAKNLIRLEPDDRDGRAKRVFLTPEGRAMREDCVRRAADHLDDVVAAFGAGAFVNALPFLRELRQHLDRNREPQG